MVAIEGGLPAVFARDEIKGAKRWIVLFSLVLCIIMFIILEVYTYHKAPEAVYTMIALLIASFVAEAIWQKFRKRCT